jgi:hypothetical protein
METKITNKLFRVQLGLSIKSSISRRRFYERQPFFANLKSLAAFR